ncbi:MAG: 3-methyl-2-oxobutanoate hydroxymethyltransferase [Thiohalocapsa sp. PB-PSB1]|jgi:3-methyl-2-oxobutanoate hydroxymethyltransferase|nr:MAG: 3-methyl-2-oxobutanoate hydroxymethyltransferase [Thiohalocapsa sp. PB-PSB1]HCS91504.1 3-methyl-2-oxobutanoate hydroxymethyltransferase [Chromatiaceae bacterium]
MSSDPITSASLVRMKKKGERIVCLTCYDAAFCRVLEAAGVDVLLVGDSLGMVLQGQATTVPVNLEHMVYHTRCVSNVRERALLIADMPFLSYATPQRAFSAAERLMGEGGAAMVKLEGGAAVVETVRALTRFGAPVCAHLGLLPQSVHQLGGYRYQGKDDASSAAIRADALSLQDAGASMLVLECVPQQLASDLSVELEIPVIGIGAGNRCNGQVLVLHDLLGLTPGRRPRFSHNFMDGSSSIAEAIVAYVTAVRSGKFPGPEHTLF